MIRRNKMKVKYFLIGMVVIFVAGVLNASSYAKIDSKTAIGIWLLDEGKGDITADSSGNKNDGTLGKSPVWVDGKFGNALEFNAIDNYVDAGNNAILYPAKTVSVFAWVYSHNVGPADYPRIVSTLKNDGTWKGYEIYQIVGTNSIAVQINTGGSFAGYVIGALAKNVWAHVGFTFDGKSIITYFNGVASNPNSDPGDITYTVPAANLRIGLNPNVGSNFDGTIDEVAVFNAVLIDQDIKSIMTDGIDKALSLTAVDSAGKLATTWGDLKTSR
jgi:hypothetical protein